MRAPVSGLRSGAPDGIVRRAKTTRSPKKRKQRVPQTARLVGRKFSSSLRRWAPALGGAALGLVLAQPWLDRPFGDERDEDRQDQHGRDREPEVRRQTDRDVGIDQMNGVVRELDQHSIERLDQHVHGERAGDSGEPQGQAGEGMAVHAQEGRACQWNQDEVAGVRRDARHDAHERHDVGQRPGRGDQDQLADQRLHQAGLLRDAGSHHGDDHEPHRGEAHEIRDQPLVHEADPVCRQQTPRGGCCRLELVGLRIENLIGDARSQHVQELGEHDDDGDEDQKNHRRVRDLVSHPLDHIQEFLHGALRRRDGMADTHGGGPFWVTNSVGDPLVRAAEARARGRLRRS